MNFPSIYFRFSKFFRGTACRFIQLHRSIFLIFSSIVLSSSIVFFFQTLSNTFSNTFSYSSLYAENIVYIYSLFTFGTALLFSYIRYIFSRCIPRTRFLVVLENSFQLVVQRISRRLKGFSSLSRHCHTIVGTKKDYIWIKLFFFRFFLIVRWFYNCEKRNKKPKSRQYEHHMQTILFYERIRKKLNCEHRVIFLISLKFSCRAWNYMMRENKNCEFCEIKCYEKLDNWNKHCTSKWHLAKFCCVKTKRYRTLPQSGGWTTYISKKYREILKGFLFTLYLYTKEHVAHTIIR